MQTIYYTTRNFVRSQGNVVDLGEYRRKLDMVRQTSLAPDYAEDYREEAPRCEAPAPIRLVTEEESLRLARRERRSRRRERGAWAMDLLASLSVVAMTAAFTLTVLMT